MYKKSLHNTMKNVLCSDFLHTIKIKPIHGIINI